MAYSMDFRRSVAAAYDECGSSDEVAEIFNCSGSWVRRLIQHRRERGTLEPLTTARHDDQRSYNDADELAIRELIRHKPDVKAARDIWFDSFASYMLPGNPADHWRRKSASSC